MRIIIITGLVLILIAVCAVPLNAADGWINGVPATTDESWEWINGTPFVRIDGSPVSGWTHISTINTVGQSGIGTMYGITKTGIGTINGVTP